MPELQERSAGAVMVAIEILLALVTISQLAQAAAVVREWRRSNAQRIIDHAKRFGFSVYGMRCMECGGTVDWRYPAPKHRRIYRDGTPRPFPPWIMLPTCLACGEIYLNKKLIDAIEGDI